MELIDKNIDIKIFNRAYELYCDYNKNEQIIFSEIGFINSEEYRNYYNLAIKLIRIQKLNKICSK